MMTTHVSELAIDRMLAGELLAGDASAMRDHAAGCADCHARLAEAQVLQRDYRGPRLPVLAPRRRYAIYGAASALAAAVVFVVAWPRDSSTTRTKGSAIVGVFVSHGGEVRRGSPTETVMPGDRIELCTTTTEPMWFAAVSSDGSVYVAPRPIAAGREQVVPLAIELDATLGTEVVTGVFCPEAFDAKAPPASCTRDHVTLVKVPR